MTLMEWLRLRLGTPIDIDGVDGAQCVDAINAYLRDVRHVGRVSGNAVDIAKQEVSGFVWRPNSANNAPRPGSIVVWAANYASLNIGPFGHTAVSVYSDSHGLLTADQNWSSQQVLSIWSHDYRDVVGWHYPTE